MCDFPHIHPNTSYRKGCRCSRCREEKRISKRKQREKAEFVARERAQERLRCQNPDYKAKKTAHNSLRRSLERISFRLLNKEEKQQIYNIYEESHKMTQSSGNTYQVDHIIPLAHGGLHVPENLQILSQEENLKKGTSVDGIRKDKIESSLRAIVARYGQVLQKLSDF